MFDQGITKTRQLLSGYDALFPFYTVIMSFSSGRQMTASEFTWRL